MEFFIQVINIANNIVATKCTTAQIYNYTFLNAQRLTHFIF